MRPWIVSAGLLIFALVLSAAEKPDQESEPAESSFEKKLILEHEQSAFEKCAEGAFTQDALEATLETCNEVVAKQPDNGDVYYFRGFHFYYLDRFKYAEADFSTAITLETRYLAESYYQRGVCKEQQRRLREASVDFKKAHDLKPNWSPARRKVEEYHWAYE